MRFSVGDVVRYLNDGPFSRWVLGRSRALVIVHELGMGDNPRYDYTVRPLRKVVSLLRFDVRKEDIAPLDAVTMLGDLA